MRQNYITKRNHRYHIQILDNYYGSINPCEVCGLLKKTDFFSQ